MAHRTETAALRATATAAMKRKPKTKKPARKPAKGKTKAQALQTAMKAEMAREREWSDLQRQAKAWEKPAISNARDAILALGGPEAVQDWLGSRDDQLLGWLKDGGCFPPGYHLRIYVALVGLGYRISPAVFGYNSWEEIRRPHLRLPDPAVRPVFLTI
jgi:hypothetical protein